MGVLSQAGLFCSSFSDIDECIPVTGNIYYGTKGDTIMLNN